MTTDYPGCSEDESTLERKTTMHREPELTIYLAGKVRGQKHEIARENTPACWNEYAGPVVRFVCSDGSTHSAHRWGIGCNFDDCSDGGLREEVARTALAQLDEADLLFAYLDTADSFGSIAEIAYFSALGKPSLVTVLTGGKVSYDEMFDAYWFVCSLPNVTVRQVDNLGTASAMLDELLGGYEIGVFGGAVSRPRRSRRRRTSRRD
jgi:nucleoside 2-deoxyribosyltransferase